MSELKLNLEGDTIRRLLVEAVREHNVLPLTGRCNLNCCFCSHKFNPPETEAYGFPPLPEGLICDLVDYLDPEKKIIIGESATRLREGEPLTHPQFKKIINHLRKRYPETLIQLTTNATLMNRSAIDFLKELEPLEIVVSLNSSSKIGRRLLMADPQPITAIKAVEILGEYNIKFHGSIVALPNLVGFDDLESTITYLSLAGAQTVRVLLPGFTKHTSNALIPNGDTLSSVLRIINELKCKLSTALLVEPPLIENLSPLVDGVIENSPAGRAGIQKGDLIISVNASVPFCRVDAFRSIANSRNPIIKIKRSDTDQYISIIKNSGESSGLIMSFDLDPIQIETVRSTLTPGKETLMLVSKPAYLRWQLAIKRSNLLNLILEPVSSFHFGGSINSAGLLTVSDYQKTFNNLKNKKDYSLILLPTISFDSRGNDLTGTNYLTLDTGNINYRLIR